MLLALLDADAGPEIVFAPMLLVGLGIGALASQLGAVTVSPVLDDQSPEVGGVQNTMTNLGASMGTALAGSVMIAAVTPPSSSTSSTVRRSRPTSSRRRQSSSRAACRSSRTPTSSRRSTTQARAMRRPRPRSTRLCQRPHQRARVSVGDPRGALPRRALLHAARPEHAAGSARRPSLVRQRLLGPVAAGGSAIDARRLVSGVSGTRMRPRVGRSRSNVTRSSSVTRAAARRTVTTPRPRSDR